LLFEGPGLRPSGHRGARGDREPAVNRIADYALIGDCHSAALVGRDGSIDWACFPRFDSPAVFCKLLDEVRGGAFALAPKDVRSTQPLGADPDGVWARWPLEAGQEAWIEAAWSRSYELPKPAAGGPKCAPELLKRLEDTVAFWRAWIERCWYRGEWEGAVRRSALVLKALTYAPRGAVVAASATALPELVGGIRNWDYR